MVRIRIIIFLITISYYLFRVAKQFWPSEEANIKLAKAPRNAHIVKRIHRELITINTYYSKLSKTGQLRFIARIMYLLPRKKFIGYHDLQVTFPMKVMVLSALVQLTFGYKRFSLPKFKRLIMYPEQFYSRYFQRDVKGLTTGMGFVTLSWKDTFEGFKDHSDNLNLALHEFAHALELSVNKLDNPEIEIGRLFNKYEQDVLHFFHHFKRNKTRSLYLRSYSMANQHEFFSVVIEHFFETPLEFEQRLSPLYHMLCRLLNQDPLNMANDYQLK